MKYDLWGVASTGEARIHFEVLSQIVTTSSDDAYVPMAGTNFVATYTGLQGVTYYWKLSGSEGICNGNILGIGHGHVTVTIHSNVKDVATGYWVNPNTNQTVILDADYDIPIIPWCFQTNWNNNVYSVTTVGNLISGRTYRIYSYLEGYIYVTSLFLSSNYAWDDLDGYLTQASYYVSGGGGCLASGTPVLMANGGTKPIEKVQDGDSVMGYDLARGEMAPVTVTKNTPTRVDQVEVINDGLLTVTTVDQPLYVRNGSWEGWIRNPSQLQAGMELFNPASGGWTRIYLIETIAGNFRVWDLATTPLNNFIANGILVDKK